MDIKLIVQKPKTSLREVKLRRPRTVVGRKKGCKVRIRAGGVSRIHCVLLRQDNQIVVKDLTSTNGTFVNGQRVTMAELQAGDVLRVGPLQFMIQIDGVPPVAAEDAQIVGDDEIVPDDAEVIFETSDDDADDVADESPAVDDLDQLIVPTEGEGKVDLKSLAASLHPPPADNAENFLIDDDDEPAREQSTFGLAGDDDVPPPRKKPKPH